jgi:hypothetical protein
VDAARLAGGNALLLRNHAGRRNMSQWSARYGVPLSPRLADALGIDAGAAKDEVLDALTDAINCAATGSGRIEARVLPSQRPLPGVRCPAAWPGQPEPAWP